jgi:hypothetical protein
MLNLIGFRTLTFHNALTAAEQNKLITRFNTIGDDLRAIILPYRVDALGNNCQGDYSSLIVMSCAGCLWDSRFGAIQALGMCCLKNIRLFVI